MIRNLCFAASLASMIAVALAEPRPVSPPPLAATPVEPGLVAHAAWLAERESAVGDWESVRPPLRAGDELQLTVRADEDAWVYVLSVSGATTRVIFPARDQAPSLARVRAGWQYAIPGRHLTWRLDDADHADHDRLVMVVSRRELARPAEMLDATPGGRTVARAESDVELPLRDGRPGTAQSRTLWARQIIVEELLAR